MRHLDQLLTEAIAADFTGCVSVEVHVASGRLLKVKKVCERSLAAND